MNKKIKILIVDDSMVFREALRRGLEKDSNLEVIGAAANPYEARDMIIEYEPDVMTLDIELPRMDGIEFLRKLMPQYPIPVVVVSAVSSKVFEALDAGAVDFVTKPSAGERTSLESFISELIVKLKIASIAKVSHWKDASHTIRNVQGNINNITHNKIIAIGASTGGTEAIEAVLRGLPYNMPGIVIVQHMPPVFTKMYAERLNRTCALEVKEAENGDTVISGRVLIASGDYHMRVKKSGSTYSVECFKGEKVNGHCPSVDVLFNSVAEKAGSNALGVILTGMGYDGAKGLLNMRKKGAITFGQDEASSVVYGMPKVAYEIGAVQRQLALNDIAGAIYSSINEK